ncbi:MAG: hypothetical protein WA123_06795 [Methylotenera sp.]
MVLSEIADLCAKFELDQVQIDAYCKSSEISEYQLFDDLAKYIAHGYAKNQLTFEFCDAVINEVWRMSETDLSNYAYSVYSAFDQGEFYRLSDTKDVEPHEIYTRPLINQIIANE